MLNNFNNNRNYWYVTKIPDNVYIKDIIIYSNLFELDISFDFKNMHLYASNYQNIKLLNKIIKVCREIYSRNINS